LAFAASLTSLAVAGWTAGLLHRWPHASPLPALHTPSMVLARLRSTIPQPGTSTTTKVARQSLALMGLSAVRPSSDISCTSPLRETTGVASLGSHLPERESRSTHTVSHRFDGLLQVQTPGMLQPEPDRVRHVLPCPTSLFHRDRPDDTPKMTMTPRNAVRTLQRISLAGSRKHVTVPHCLLAVTSTRLPVRHLRPLMIFHWERSQTLKQQNRVDQPNDGLTFRATLSVDLTKGTPKRPQHREIRHPIHRRPQGSRLYKRLTFLHEQRAREALPLIRPRPDGSRRGGEVRTFRESRIPLDARSDP